MSQLKGWRTIIFNAGMVLLSGGTVSAAAEGFLTPQQLELAFTIISSAWGFGSLIFRIYTTTPLGQKTVAAVEGWSQTNLGMPAEQFFAPLFDAVHRLLAGNAAVAKKVDNVQATVSEVQAKAEDLHTTLVPVDAAPAEPTLADLLAALATKVQAMEVQAMEAERHDPMPAKPNVLEAIAAATPPAEHPLAIPDPSAPAAPVGASVIPPT
jgi:hypothetical protein